MYRILKLIAAAFLLAAAASAQNWTTVSASNITDLNQNKLVAGQLCFLGTDQNDNPISFSIGGGGQALRRAFCSAVAAGSVTSFTVPNPQNTSPAGIYYRVTVKDSSTGQEVLRYTQVTFAGSAFNFDNYAPANLGSFTPLSGNSVTGSLNVTGNLAATGTVTGSNVTTNSLKLTETTAPSGTAGSDVLYADSTAHRWKMNNNNAGPDTVVGAATTDTLNNKVLNGAGNGNAVTLLNMQGAQPALTGNSTDQAMFTYTLPANTLGPGKGLRITVAWFHAVGTASTTYKLLIGGSSVFSTPSTGVDNGFIEYITYEIINNAGVQNAQTILGKRFLRIAGTPAGMQLNPDYAQGTSAVNFANSQTINASFNVANTDQVTPKYFLVELIQ
jgi:hypothetical protein